MDLPIDLARSNIHIPCQKGLPSKFSEIDVTTLTYPLQQAFDDDPVDNLEGKARVERLMWLVNRKPIKKSQNVVSYKTPWCLHRSLVHPLKNIHPDQSIIALSKCGFSGKYSKSLATILTSTYPKGTGGDLICDRSRASVFDDGEMLVVTTADGCGWGERSSRAAQAAVQYGEDEFCRELMMMTERIHLLRKRQISSLVAAKFARGVEILLGDESSLLGVRYVKKKIVNTILAFLEENVPPWDPLILDQKIKAAIKVSLGTKISYLGLDFFERKITKSDLDLLQYGCSINDIAHAMVVGAATVEKALLNESFQKATTTYLQTVAAKQKGNDDQYDMLMYSVGDMKAFLFRHDARQVIELTPNNRHGTDVTDPGGRLGKFPDYSDLRNAQLFHYVAQKGDILIQVSDGVHDCLVASEIGVETVLSTTEFSENVLSALLRNVDNNPSKIATIIANHATLLTAPTRAYMEGNPHRRQPQDNVLYPGKVDHVLVTVARIGS